MVQVRVQFVPQQAFGINLLERHVRVRSVQNEFSVTAEAVSEYPKSCTTFPYGSGSALIGLRTERKRPVICFTRF